MKKILALVLTASLFLTACASNKTMKTEADVESELPDVELSEDAVLWTNSDGTDCDLGDWLEGDKDCKKKKKKVYHKMDTKVNVKPKASIAPKKKTTTKKKSTFTTTKKKSTFKSSTRKKRR